MARAYEFLFAGLGADPAEDMQRIGRGVERRVLARAVRWHIKDRVMVDGTRTVVFQ